MGMISRFLDLTIRVGCHLTYEKRPHRLPWCSCLGHVSTTHILSLLRSDHLNLIFPRMSSQDSHGNFPCRSMLKACRNDIRYDALVAVSSTPENQGASASPQSQFTSFRQNCSATLCPAAIVILINSSISHGSTSAISPMGMNGCRPFVTGFTATSNIATARGGRISPHQR